MIKTGFFNAVNNDRDYNADDICNFFQGIVEDGVFKYYLGGLEVIVDGSNNIATVKSGKCIVGGKYILNTSDLTFEIPTASDMRYDSIIAYADLENRTAGIRYITDSENLSPTESNTFKFIELAEIVAYQNLPSELWQDTRIYIRFTNLNQDISERVIDLSLQYLSYDSQSETFYKDLSLDEYNPDDGEIVQAYVDGKELYNDNWHQHSGPATLEPIGIFGITNINATTNRIWFGTYASGSENVLYYNKNYNTTEQTIIVKFTKNISQ